MGKGKPLVSTFMVLCFFAAGVAAVEKPDAETLQQEEQFSQPVQELTGEARIVQVYSHIYGAGFMSEKERCEYLLKLDSTQDLAEREKIRAEHRKHIDMLKLEKGG
jgi:hypothetical protein